MINDGMGGLGYGRQDESKVHAMTQLRFCVEVLFSWYIASVLGLNYILQHLF